jgi:hypothetical protein
MTYRIKVEELHERDPHSVLTGKTHSTDVLTCPEWDRYFLGLPDFAWAIWLRRR